MGLFSKVDPGAEEARIKELEKQIDNLTREIDRLHKAIDDKTEELGLSDEVVALKKQITTLEITASKKNEEFDKRERELEHMIGLERKRQEVELAQAKRDAELTVRETNLDAATNNLKEQMEFFKSEMGKQVAYLKDDIVKALLNRLPTVTVDRYIEDAPGGRKKAVAGKDA